jgi:hypothetical protein
MADVGNRIRVQEESFNASGQSNLETSAATSVVAPLAPANISPPSISASITVPFAVGATATEVHGAWSPTPTSYTYQWLDCNSAGTACTPIAGATSQTYALATTDIGDTLRVQESATDAGGTGGPATSAATPVVLPDAPVNIEPPSLEHDLTQDQVLTEVQGSWSNSPTRYTYQWQRCANTASCVNISGATAATYGVGVGDEHTGIRVEVK